MADRDVLFAVRNNFYIGAHQSVLSEAAELEDLSGADQIERDCFSYRSYIALGSYELVINEVTPSSATALQAVKLLAEYLSKKKDKEDVLSTLGDWLGDAACNRNPTVLLIAGIIYAQEGNYVEALRACHSGLTLEMMALCVQVYIKMDRADKADQQVKAMSAVDDDSVITQLATAWAGIALGGAKVQEAWHIYTELGDKFHWTAALYNGRAVCSMKMGEWEDAEKDLLEAFAKDAKDPDTLANLVTAGLHVGKGTSRYSSQLKMLAPGHPMVARAEAGEAAFARAAAAMA